MEFISVFINRTVSSGPWMSFNNFCCIQLKVTWFG